MDISKVSLCPKSEVIILYSILKTKNHWSRYIKTCLWIKIHENLSLDQKVHKTTPFWLREQLFIQGSSGDRGAGQHSRAVVKRNQTAPSAIIMLRTCPLGYASLCTGPMVPEQSLISQHTHSCFSGTARSVFLLIFVLILGATCTGREDHPYVLWGLPAFPWLQLTPSSTDF